jgi:hypothetical protein
MNLGKNKKLTSILLLVVPLVVGILMAMYFIPPSARIHPPESSQLNLKTNHNDSIGIKLDLILKEINQLDERMKKLEIIKLLTKDSLDQKLHNKNAYSNTSKSIQTKKNTSLIRQN